MKKSPNFFIIEHEDGEHVWTASAMWGKIPKIYPNRGRAVQALKYHGRHRMKGANIVEYDAAEKSREVYDWDAK